MRKQATDMNKTSKTLVTLCECGTLFRRKRILNDLSRISVRYELRYSKKLEYDHRDKFNGMKRATF
jgi:hypothetical protein